MSRRGRGRMSNRRDDRRKSAEQRKQDRSMRTDKQQLTRLDELFGPGQGAARERARLIKRIQLHKEQTKAAS